MLLLDTNTFPGVYYSSSPHYFKLFFLAQHFFSPCVTYLFQSGTIQSSTRMPHLSGQLLANKITSHEMRESFFRNCKHLKKKNFQKTRQFKIKSQSFLITVCQLKHFLKNEVVILIKLFRSKNYTMDTHFSQPVNETSILMKKTSNNIDLQHYQVPNA